MKSPYTVLEIVTSLLEDQPLHLFNVKRMILFEGEVNSALERGLILGVMHGLKEGVFQCILYCDSSRRI